MKYLIAIDSDGTLRHSDGNISDKTKKIIKKVVDCGNIVVICTARPRYYTLKISNEVGLNEYLISSNGTEIYDNVNKKNIYSTYLPKEECKIIYQETKKLGLRVMFVAENTEYVTMFTRNDSQILLDDNNAYTLLKKEIKQIMIISKEKELVKKYKSSIEQKSNLCVVDSSGEDKEELWFSVISSDSSKGNSLKVLAEYLDIPIKNTIAIGNDNNDISMIDIAGIGVAVENSTDQLKKHADYITKSNDEDGVADYLIKFLNNNNY